eukprot:g4469.t1
MLAARMPSRGATCEVQHDMPTAAGTRRRLHPRAMAPCPCPPRLCSPDLVHAVFHPQARTPCPCLLDCERLAVRLPSHLCRPLKHFRALMPSVGVAWLLCPWPILASYYPRVPFDTSLYPVQSYVLDVPSGTHGSRTVRLCYHKGDISFDLCCDERFGPTGNPDCWDSIDTFEECCSSAQWELLTTPWPREKIFHNAHLAVQLDRDPRWFSFPFPEQIRAALKEETANLWTHVREACSLSALVALTIFSAALQQRVSLASRDHLAMRVEEVWRQFQEALSEIFLQMKSEHALVDITGVPLLGSMEVILIWQSWMDLSFKDQELTELSLAEKVFQCAQGAYYATEDLYYSRLRPRLLEGCGADCAALSGNRVISQPSRLRPAPRSVPTVQSMEQRCRRWSKDSVEDLMRLVRQMGPEPLRWPAFDEFVAYDSEDLNSTARFLASLKDSDSDPFSKDLLKYIRLPPIKVTNHPIPKEIEAMLLEFGVASKVSTLEYANLSACPDRHPHLQPLLPEDFNAGYLSEERFDGFVQWSSVEHSGLGMYGDEINPWGDRQTVAQLWATVFCCGENAILARRAGCQKK